MLDQMAPRLDNFSCGAIIGRHAGPSVESRTSDRRERTHHRQDAMTASGNHVSRSPALLSGWLASMRVAQAAPHLRAPVLDVGCGSRALLSTYFGSHEYVGVELKPRNRDSAERLHPGYQFLLPHELNADQRFASVAALAVLEHVSDPAAFVRELASRLAPAGTLVMTTPHPIAGGVHTAGARLGLFSASAAEEHQQLYDRRALSRMLSAGGLELQLYRRFMLGMNQLVVATGPGE